MVLCGLLVAGVVVLSFSHLDQSNQNDYALGRARSLADLMEKFREGGQVGDLEVDARDIIADGSHSLRVCNGSIWLLGPSGDHAVTGPHGYLFIYHGNLVEEITIRQGDQLRLSNERSADGSLISQLEKVDARVFTASTNRLASSSVL